MNLEEKVKQSDRTISMHSAIRNGRQQDSDVVRNPLSPTKAERMLCISPEIERTIQGTFGSERENSGFSV
jgi:hypothetical protein